MQCSLQIKAKYNDFKPKQIIKFKKFKRSKSMNKYDISHICRLKIIIITFPSISSDATEHPSSSLVTTQSLDIYYKIQYELDTKRSYLGSIIPNSFERDSRSQIYKKMQEHLLASHRENCI
jgi:hypothetical protein